MAARTNEKKYIENFEFSKIIELTEREHCI